MVERSVLMVPKSSYRTSGRASRIPSGFWFWSLLEGLGPLFRDFFAFFRFFFDLSAHLAPSCVLLTIFFDFASIFVDFGTILEEFLDDFFTIFRLIIENRDLVKMCVFPRGNH